MTRILPVLAFIWLAMMPAVADVGFNWDNLPALPAVGDDAHLGLAGPFVGVHHDILIVAGGANFPEGLPWNPLPDGSAPPKVYHPEIYLLNLASETPAWQVADTKLQRGLGYGVSITTADGLVCIGGEWKEPNPDGGQILKRSAAVFRLSIDPVSGNVSIDDSLPPLPAPTTMLSGAAIGSKIYVAAGDSGNGPSRNFWELDLANLEAGWTTLPGCPGPPRVLPIAAAQNDGTAQAFYLFSGRNPGKTSGEMLADSWKFTPGTNIWTPLDPIAIEGEERCIMAGTAVQSGVQHILVLGGANGKLFMRLAFELPQAIAAATEAGDSAKVAALEKEKLGILNNHPGFTRDVLAYHTITDTWTKIGEMSGDTPVTTTAVRWGEQIIVPSGEKSPGIRTPQVLRGIPYRDVSFGTLNYAVLILYLVALIINGMWFSRKMKTTDDFFKAGGRIPWWAAGLSIMGTQLSAITFIAVPASSFATDWRRFVAYVGIITVAPFVIFLFLPFYRRLNVTTAYEYLEQRFNVVVRTFGSIMFMLLQFGRIGIVLLLPSLALSVVTGLSVDTCILVMGLLCVVYTVLGGMEAVIWTDVTQVAILTGGALLALVLMPAEIEGGWNAMINIADAQGKFRLLDFRFDFTEAAFFVIVFGSLSQNLISYGTDQAVIQRYLTTKDERSAGRSIWLNALVAIPAGMLFLGIGTALFSFYRTHPAALDPTLANGDAVFPYFIITQLPAGVAGLLIAAVFAASMSSLDSAMNSVSAAVTTDFYRRFKSEVSEVACLRVARIVTVTVGLLGTGFALVMAHSDVKSLWDQFAGLLGLFGGGLGGVFILAIFTRRTHGVGAVVGLVASGICQYFVSQSDINKWFYAFTGIVSCAVIGYVASLIIPSAKKPIDGLTIYTLKKPEGATESW